MAKFYLTTPIYYVNARPHIGHAYTTLAADVIARFRKMAGDDVFFLAGTDEHGAKVAEAARAAGKPPQKFADEVADEFQLAWKNLGIEYSDFIRTTEPRHEQGAAAFLSLLKDKGALYEGEYRGLYCTGCENFITEKELADGLCPIHKKAPEQVAEKNLFFKLADYLSKVEELIKEDKILIRPDFAKKEALGLVKQGLADFSVSREKVKWGIKLPWDSSQTIYVWVEALLNYITGRGYPKLAKDSWPADLQLIGKDILKFHAIFWPAMLLAAGLEPPRQLFAHGYFTIDGEKMSKTLGNVIDPNALVKEYGADAARYLLLSQFPFGQDGDIKAERFKEQYNADLANGLGNLVSRVINVAASIFPPFQGGAGVVLKCGSASRMGLGEGIDILWQHIEEHYNNLRLEEVLAETRRLIQASDKIVESERIWELPKNDTKRAGEVFYILLENLRHIAWLIRPFMPQTSDKIFAQLGIPDEGKKTLADAKVWGGLPAAVKVKKSAPLFPRK